MGYQELISRQGRVGGHCVGVYLFLIFTYHILELVDFKFEVGITSLEVFVYVAQREVGCDVVGCPVDT